MQRTIIILLAIGVLGFIPSEIFARGGGGGGRAGGGGGGGGARAGGGFSPSAAPRPAPAARPAAPARPSAPSAAPRPSPSGPVAAGPRPGGPVAGGPGAGPRPGGPGGATPGAGARPGGPNVAGGGRPSTGQLNNFLEVPGAGGAGANTVRAGGGAAADFLKTGTPAQLPAGGVANRAATGTGTRTGVAAATTAAAGVAAGRGIDAGRTGTPRENLAQNRPERIGNRQQSQQDRQQRRDEVRNQYEQNNPGNFWQENPGWTAWAISRPFAYATWGSVGSWCGSSGEAMPYAYGENVYYSGDQVYYGDQPVATTEQYAEQAEAIANSAPTTPNDKAEWMPLGVFAITQDGQASGTQPSLYVQLAISKQAVISGTLKNTLTNKVQELEGMADTKSQRVAWSVKGQDRPIMETGLANLTQDASPALVHFADGQTQQWLMVRIPEPKQ